MVILKPSWLEIERLFPLVAVSDPPIRSRMFSIDDVPRKLRGYLFLRAITESGDIASKHHLFVSAMSSTYVRRLSNRSFKSLMDDFTSYREQHDMYKNLYEFLRDVNVLWVQTGDNGAYYLTGDDKRVLIKFTEEDFWAYVLRVTLEEYGLEVNLPIKVNRMKYVVDASYNDGATIQGEYALCDELGNFRLIGDVFAELQDRRNTYQIRRRT